MNTHLVPYLNFDGNCKDAMMFYQSVLGGNLSIQTFEEAFPETPQEHKNRVMHASLEAESIRIMASDTSPEYGPPFVQGNNVHLSIIGNDESTLREWFGKLAEGGTVTMPMEKQFWGDVFGMLIDKFGVNWMINVASQ